MTKYVILIILSTCLAMITACGWHPNNITGPTAENLAQWSPCVNVHSDAIGVQKWALEKLRSVGRVTWVRLDATLDGRDSSFYQMAKSLGFNIIAILKHDDIIKYPSPEATFDRAIQLYPQADVWQISGEIQHWGPYQNQMPIDPKYYMERILKPIYSYAKTKYPFVRLTSAPTEGSVKGGGELEQFVQFGLLDMPDDLIIAVNVYNDETLDQYANVLNRHPGRHPVFVTETGYPQMAGHIGWVSHMYPKIRNMINPELVCWYVLWEGEQPLYGKEYGMIKGITPNFPQVLPTGPLFEALIGGVK